MAVIDGGAGCMSFTALNSTPTTLSSREATTTGEPPRAICLTLSRGNSPVSDPPWEGALACSSWAIPSMSAAVARWMLYTSTLLGGGEPTAWMAPGLSYYARISTVAGMAVLLSVFRRRGCQALTYCQPGAERSQGGLVVGLAF